VRPLRARNAVGRAAGMSRNPSAPEAALRARRSDALAVEKCETAIAADEPKPPPGAPRDRSIGDLPGVVRDGLESITVGWSCLEWLRDIRGSVH
jgi:hypothetical protein